MGGKEDTVTPRKATLKALLGSADREGWVATMLPRRMRDQLYHPQQSARSLGWGVVRKPELKGRYCTLRRMLTM